MRYNKLVRSNIPGILEAQQIPYKVRTASYTEYVQKLYEKLLEETMEVIKDHSREELADLLEVIEAIKKLNGWTNEEIEEIRLQKRSEKGDFESPIILIES